MARLRKKAQNPGDAILAIAFLMMIAIGGLIATYAYNEFYDAAMEDPVLNASQASRDAFAAGKTVNAKWDYLIFFMFIGLFLGMMVIAYFIDVHSIFMPFFILAMVIGVIIASVISYTWEQVSDVTEFATIKANSFKVTNHLMNYLEIYFTIMAGMALLVTYAKPTNIEGVG